MRRLLPLLALVLLLPGCWREKPPALRTALKTPGALRIAVVPFENTTPNPKAGEDLARFAYNELFRMIHRERLGAPGHARFDVLDEHAVRAVLLERKWEDVGAIRDAGIKPFCQALGCDLLLMGAVSEYHYKRGLGEDPVLSMHLRLYDVKTGAVMWSGSISRTGRFSWFVEDALGRLGQEACRDLLRGFRQEMWERFRP